MSRLVHAGMLMVVLSSCSRAPEGASPALLYAFQYEPAAIVATAPDHGVLRELPLVIPEGCRLQHLSAAPRGPMMAIELGCSFGEAVVLMNTASGRISQPVKDSDSHLLAWAVDGEALYLKVDSLSRPRIVRATLNGKAEGVPITELTYDLAPRPVREDEFIFSFSRGMGLGSEMWLAERSGGVVRQLLADPGSYVSLARWSPDGNQVAFIKIPDAATPFTVGELWVMQADGDAARKLADADAGHGFAAAWSPDGRRVAYVARENPEDAAANQQADALRSNLWVVDIQSGVKTALTRMAGARVEAPSWSPDGNNIAFSAVLDDKMNAYILDVASGQVKEALAVSACCPAWIRE